jgi:hypothetical protein
MAVVTPQGDEIFRYQAPPSVKPGYISPKDYLSEYLEKETPMHSLCAATIFRREALKAAGDVRFKELGHWADTFAARVIGLKHGACYIPETCSFWAVSANSLSQSGSADVAGAIRMIETVEGLMRSDLYKGLFPETYIRTWAEGYRKFIIWSGHGVVRRTKALVLRAVQYRIFRMIFFGIFPLIRAILKGFIRGRSKQKS